MSANGLARRLAQLESHYRPAIVQAGESALLEPTRAVARAAGVDEEALVHGVRCMALTVNSDRAAGFTAEQTARSLHLTWVGLRTGVSLDTAVRLAVALAAELERR